MLTSLAQRNQHWKLPIRLKQRYLWSYERRWKLTDDYAELLELERRGRRLLVGRWIWKVSFF